MCFTIFPNEIFNIDVEATKIVTEMQTINRIITKFIIMKNFENFGLNMNIFEEKCHFYKYAIYSKLHFAL